MKIAYFDCFSGVSGDMTIAAFLNAGLKFETLSRELAKLNLKGYKLKKTKVLRGTISGTKFDCISDNKPHGHRSLQDINTLIGRSSLKAKVKDIAKNIFKNIAEAETKIHGKSNAKDIIFHELGDIDSIVDIVGTAIAIDELGIDAVYSSKVTMGRTVVYSRHGLLPVPSPASLELLKGVPITMSDIEAELVTPTGAGIIKTLSKKFGEFGKVNISAIGYGAGSKDIPDRPNMLRILIGETCVSPKVRSSGFAEDNVLVVETNIDDMNPQHIGRVIEKVMAAGAVDAYITNILMKKSRPAFKLTAIVEAEKLQKVTSVIFDETTAIGLRIYEVNRLKLDRNIKKVKTAYGQMEVKVSKGPGNILTVTPEHDDCIRVADVNKVPLRKVYDAVKKASMVSLVFGFLCLLSGLSAADVVSMNNGEEQKGIVVEDYKDRIILSTIYGEKTIMKSDIKELYYDEEEQNLIKLAEQARQRNDYTKAFAYYNMAFKANPNSKAARDGMVFLEGYLFRKEQAQKEADVKRRDDIERHGVGTALGRASGENTAEKSAHLKKAIGITLDMKDGFPFIDSIGMNSPAHDAGLEKGDKLIAIWARLTGYMDLDEVLDALLDKPSLELKCTIERTLEIPVAAYGLVAPGTMELIGASFSMEFDGLTVAFVKSGGASGIAGLKKSDIITAIDGKPTRYMPLNDAIKMIRNSKDKSIRLTIKREVLIWRRD